LFAKKEEGTDGKEEKKRRISDAVRKLFLHLK